MTNQSSIKYISSLLDNPGSITDGDHGSIGLFRQTFPYFVPVRYIQAAVHHRKSAFSPAMISEIQPYMGNWILLCEMLEMGRKNAKGGIEPFSKTADKKYVDIANFLNSELGENSDKKQSPKVPGFMQSANSGQQKQPPVSQLSKDANNKSKEETVKPVSAELKSSPPISPVVPEMKVEKKEEPVKPVSAEIKATSTVAPVVPEVKVEKKEEPVKPVSAEIKATPTAAPVVPEVKAEKKEEPVKPVSAEIKATPTAAPVVPEVKVEKKEEPVKPVSAEIKATSTVAPVVPEVNVEKKEEPVKPVSAEIKATPTVAPVVPEVNVEKKEEPVKPAGAEIKATPTVTPVVPEVKMEKKEESVKPVSAEIKATSTVAPVVPEVKVEKKEEPVKPVSAEIKATSSVPPVVPELKIDADTKTEEYSAPVKKQEKRDALTRLIPTKVTIEKEIAEEKKTVSVEPKQHPGIKLTPVKIEAEETKKTIASAQSEQKEVIAFVPGSSSGIETTKVAEKEITPVTAEQKDADSPSPIMDGSVVETAKAVEKEISPVKSEQKETISLPLVTDYSAIIDAAKAVEKEFTAIKPEQKSADSIIPATVGNSPSVDLTKAIEKEITPVIDAGGIQYITGDSSASETPAIIEKTNPDISHKEPDIISTLADETPAEIIEYYVEAINDKTEEVASVKNEPNESDNIVLVPDKGYEDYPDEIVNDADNDLISPVYKEDYFLQQGVKISDEIPDEIDELKEAAVTDEEDKSLMVMMSFSEWLLHFKNTTEQQKEEKKDQKALKTMWQKEKLAAAMEEENEEIPENVFEMAVNSITKEDGLASESLADIYIKQGKYDKAIEMYRKLSLRNPKKNAYFARRIEEVLKEKQS